MTIDSVLLLGLEDKNVQVIAERTGLAAQTIYNFMGGRNQITEKTRVKLLSYLLNVDLKKA